MLFNSLAFLIFLPIVFAIYWAGKSVTWQNRIIVLASMFFYGWWDWRFLLLMVGTCLVNYFIGKSIKPNIQPAITDKEQTAAHTPTPTNRSSRFPLITAIVINIGLLAVFKYFNFFADNLAALLQTFGLKADIPTLHLILPIGISFYTFQLTAYVVDIYRGHLPACQSVERFLAFICFFPQLVAGPIERGQNLLPQFERKRTFDYAIATSGMRLILWGLMKKMLVADNCGPVADYVFANHEALTAADLWIGLISFTVQVYCDFSGYSDMAIGTARLFGIRLSLNFNHPFFATTIREFWRRWHMTLMAWLRDYVYFPLGGSRCSAVRHYFNVFVLYMLSGLWHGPNWSFIAWGTWNGFFNVTTKHLRMPKPLSWFVTIMVFTLSQVFFRNPTVGDGISFFIHLFSFDSICTTASRMPFLLAALLFTCEYISVNAQSTTIGEQLTASPTHKSGIPLLAHHFTHKIWRFRALRYTIYALLFAACILLGGQQAQFIYFQF